MNSTLSRVLLGTLVAGGITLFGAAAAQAAEPTTSGEDGLLSGTQALLNVDIPITVGDTAVSVIGDSSSSSDDEAEPAQPRETSSGSTSGADGAASGSQALVDVNVPITVKDTAVSVVGDSTTESTDAAPAAPAPAPAEPAEAPSTDGTDGVGSGTQVVAPITVPVTVDDTAISVIGDSTTESTDAATPTAPAPSGSTAAPTTGGSDGILSGSQVVAPITVPVTVGDTAVSVIGDSTSDSTDVAARKQRAMKSATSLIDDIDVVTAVPDTDVAWVEGFADAPVLIRLQQLRTLPAALTGDRQGE